VWTDDENLVLAEVFGSFGGDPPLLVPEWQRVTGGEVFGD
jgi:hypothetical protein